MNLPPQSGETELAARIVENIQTQGFYVANDEDLARLWGSEPLTPTEKLMRLHTFSAAHGWQATGRSECRSALFQSEKQGPVSAASWRLDGDIEKALAGRFSGVRA